MSASWIHKLSNKTFVNCFLKSSTRTRMASLMKTSAPAANKCKNFSNANKATLLVAQAPVVADLDKADPELTVVGQVKAVADKADPELAAAGGKVVICAS